MGASAKSEQKAIKLNCEVKKRDNEIAKLQDHIKRLMGIDKIHFLNSIEGTSKASGGQLL